MTTIQINPPASGPLAPAAPALYRAETILLTLILGLVLASVLISEQTGQAISWHGFGIGFFPAAGLLVLGLYARVIKGLTMLAHLAIANAIYIGFSGVIAIFIYLRFPISTPMIDPTLMRIDAALGYSWPGMVAWLAQYPTLGKVLGLVYLSSLPQLFALIAILGLARHYDTLHRTLLAGTISLLATVLFWWVWPSIGPSAYYDIAPDMAARIALITDSRFGEGLSYLAANGVPIIMPGEIIGTIAFPSYHTVMALLVVWYLRGTPLFWPAALLNLAMVPAILIHGGHHLSDMIGGIIAFALAAWLAARLVPSNKSA